MAGGSVNHSCNKWYDDYRYAYAFAIMEAHKMVDEFAQVYADVLAPKGHTPEAAWDIFCNKKEELK